MSQIETSPPIPRPFSLLRGNLACFFPRLESHMGWPEHNRVHFWQKEWGNYTRKKGGEGHASRWLVLTHGSSWGKGSSALYFRGSETQLMCICSPKLQPASGKLPASGMPRPSAVEANHLPWGCCFLAQETPLARNIPVLSSRDSRQGIWQACVLSVCLSDIPKAYLGESQFIVLNRKSRTKQGGGRLTFVRHPVIHLPNAWWTHGVCQVWCQMPPNLLPYWMFSEDSWGKCTCCIFQGSTLKILSSPSLCIHTNQPGSPLLHNEPLPLS